MNQEKTKEIDEEIDEVLNNIEAKELAKSIKPLKKQLKKMFESHDKMFSQFDHALKEFKQQNSISEKKSNLYKGEQTDIHALAKEVALILSQNTNSKQSQKRIPRFNENNNIRKIPNYLIFIVLIILSMSVYLFIKFNHTSSHKKSIFSLKKGEEIVCEDKSRKLSKSLENLQGTYKKGTYFFILKLQNKNIHCMYTIKGTK